MRRALNLHYATLSDIKAIKGKSANELVVII